MPKRKPSFNTIYISERVQECLRPIAHCALTTVVAPMGYGKTTAINWFLAEKTKGGKAVAIRMSIYSEKLPMLWRSAQDAFRFAGLDVLSAFDFPTGEAAATLVLEELCRAFSSGKTAYYLFLDDFHLLRDERAVRFICRISARLPENAHLIVASRDRFLPAGEIVRLGGNLHQIGMEHLRLNHTELAVYAHRCGAELSEQQLEALLRSSEGWFSAIYLNLRALSERGRLPDASSDIFEMFTAAMIDPLPPGRQEFLAVMGLADEFTAEMARFVTENPETDAIIQDLTCQNAFVTRLPVSDLLLEPLRRLVRRARAVPSRAERLQNVRQQRRRAHDHRKGRGQSSLGASPGGAARAPERLPGGGFDAPSDGDSGPHAPAFHLAADSEDAAAQGASGAGNCGKPRYAGGRTREFTWRVRPHHELSHV